jgi:hypothetical protein
MKDWDFLWVDSEGRSGEYSLCGKGGPSDYLIQLFFNQHWSRALIFQEIEGFNYIINIYGPHDNRIDHWERQLSRSAIQEKEYNTKCSPKFYN